MIQEYSKLLFWLNFLKTDPLHESTHFRLTHVQLITEIHFVTFVSKLYILTFYLYYWPFLPQTGNTSERPFCRYIECTDFNYGIVDRVYCLHLRYRIWSTNSSATAFISTNVEICVISIRYIYDIYTLYIYST